MRGCVGVRRGIRYRRKRAATRRVHPVVAAACGTAGGAGTAAGVASVVRCASGGQRMPSLAAAAVVRPVGLESLDELVDVPYAKDPPLGPDLDRPPDAFDGRLRGLAADKDQGLSQHRAKGLQELVPPVALGILQDLVGHVEQRQVLVVSPGLDQGVPPLPDGNPRGLVVVLHHGPRCPLDGGCRSVDALEVPAERGSVVGHGGCVVLCCAVSSRRIELVCCCLLACCFVSSSSMNEFGMNGNGTAIYFFSLPDTECVWIRRCWDARKLFNTMYATNRVLLFCNRVGFRPRVFLR
mmetsp:Transcript_5434/g.12476  ORF Transcript_5434/g.12476 Transcript_5434/m.12476 type:complete len:295 (-) Transcript_5434:71-955(-)